MTVTISTDQALDRRGQNPGHGRKVVEAANGVLWTAIKEDTDPWPLRFFWSDDDGATWSEDVSMAFNTDLSPTFPWTMFMDADDDLWVAASVDPVGLKAVAVRWFTPDGAARTAYTEQDLVSVLDDEMEQPQIVVTGYGGVGDKKLHWFGSDGGDATYRMYDVDVSALTISGPDVNITLWTDNQTPDGYTAIDFQHTGDGKTPIADDCDVYLAWVSYDMGIPTRVVRMSGASGPTWTDDTPIDLSSVLRWGAWGPYLHYDGGDDVVVTAQLQDTSNSNQDENHAWAVDFATSTVTHLVSEGPVTVGADTLVWIGGVCKLGDQYYIVGYADTGTVAIRYQEWVNNGGTGQSFGTSTLIPGASGITSAGTAVGTSHLPVGSSSTLPITWFDIDAGTDGHFNYDKVDLNQPPTAPTLVSPMGISVIKNSDLTFDWTHNDPDGDAQAEYALVRKRVT